MRYLNSLALMSMILLLGGCASTPTQESPGQFVQSSTITTVIKAKLLADSRVSSLPISVYSFKDHVTLKGKVNVKAQKEIVENIAWHTDGVKSVSNQLIVRYDE